MMLAGEASGERHGAELIEALRREYPQLEFEIFGSGGSAMRQAGADILVDVRELGIFGMVETATALGKIYRTFRHLRRAAIDRRPDAVIMIDWPEFNLRLARPLKRAGLRIIYYISPQIWAWRRYRVRTIRRTVDRLIVILPFEVDFYRQFGLTVDFVGHPLLDAVRATKDRRAFCHDHGLDAARPIISLLPGSRRSELKHIFPVMVEALLRLPPSDAQFVVPLAPTIPRSWAERLQAEVMERWASMADGEDPNGRSPAATLTFVEQDTHNALAHSILAVVASGTATLEAALLETPMIIVYRSSSLNWFLVRPLLHVDTFGMVNLVAGRKIVPELIQYDLTPDRLARTMLEFIDDEPKRQAVKEELRQLKRRLGPGQAARRAARLIVETIGCQLDSPKSAS